MKTIEEMQAAVDVIRDACQRLGIALIGVCYAEGINSEIEIVDTAALATSDIDRLTNTVERMGVESFYVEGIGDAGIAEASRVGQPAGKASSAKGATGWRPISDAPKDGTSVLLTDGFTRAVAYWEAPGVFGRNHMWVIREYSAGDYNSWIEFYDPTHWMPLPDFPNTSEPIGISPAPSFGEYDEHQ